MKNINLLLVFIIITLVSANEPKLINIPCADYKKGNVWKYYGTNEQMKSDIVTTVEFINDFNIHLKDTIRTTIEIMDLKQTSTYTMTYMLKKQKNSIYLDGEIINKNGIKSINEYNVSIPFCGEMPTNFTYISQAKYNFPKMKFTVNIKNLGKKIVKVPAGTFMAQVFQKRVKIDVLGIKKSAKTIATMIGYYVDKIGYIKLDIFGISKMPDMPRNIPSVIRGKYIIELVSYKIAK